GSPPAGAALDVRRLTPLVTSNDRFYRVDTALEIPQVGPEGWELRVGGMVDRPYALSFDELLAMPMVEEYVLLTCVSNEVGGPLVGTARWLGVPLRDLLERAGVREGATQVVGRSVDGFTTGFPTEVALDGRPALVAVGMNGEPLPIPHGFPARLVVAGLYGYVSATKWLIELELTSLEEFDAYWARRGWAKLGPVQTQSRIDVPRSGQRLRPGRTPVAGVAWGRAGIGRVQVQVDDGAWAEARLADPLSESSWRQWVYRWDATPGRHLLRVRATDLAGEAQTARVRRPIPDGATGYHTVEVESANE
ncbi:MAG: molybdopterin-dependent oxidoreductase, partial [Nitriliruptorales bacterium]